MTADPTVLPPAAPSEWEELARLAGKADHTAWFDAEAFVEAGDVTRADAEFVAFCTPERIARLLAVAQRSTEMKATLRRVGIGTSDECGDVGEMVEWFATTENGEQGCGTLDAALQMLTDAAVAEGRSQATEQFREALTAHWLTEVKCHHEAHTDTAHCYCTVWASGALPSVGEAVNAWIEHVIVAASPITETPADA